jgi:hypothetical protein
MGKKMSLHPSRPSSLCQLSGGFPRICRSDFFLFPLLFLFFRSFRKKISFSNQILSFSSLSFCFLLESPPVSDKIQEKRLFKKGAVKMYDPFDHRWIPIYDQSFLLRIFLMLLLLLLPGGILYLILRYVWQRLQDRHHQRGVFS